MTNERKSAIQRAADLISVAKLAAACGVSEQAVYKWLKKGYPPANRCPDIEAAVGGRVSRFDLLPPKFQEKTSSPPQDRQGLMSPRYGHVRSKN